MNPGTSEMHFVAALDAGHRDARRPRHLRRGGHRGGRRLRPDGRPTGGHPAPPRPRDWATASPTCTTPGGRGARWSTSWVTTPSPIRRYDAQLQSDIETVARNVSAFVRSSDVDRPRSGADAAATVAAAIGPPGSVATLILPADVSWSEGGKVRAGGSTARRRAPARRPATARTAWSRQRPPPCARSEPTALLIGGRACVGEMLGQVADIAAAHRGQAARRDLPGPTRARCGTTAGRTAGLPGRVRRHAARRAPAPRAGRRPAAGVVLRLPGQAERPRPRGLRRPHPGRSGRRRRRRGVGAGDPGGHDGAPAPPPGAGAAPLPTGPLTAQAVCEALGVLLPEGAIVSDEGNTAGPVGPRGDGRLPAPRLAVPHRGRHRPGSAGRRRRRQARARTAGRRPRGRRQRPLHAPVVVDDGSRGPGRDHHPAQQPLLRRAQHGARPGRGHRRAPGPATCSTSAVPPSTSSSWPRASASRPPGQRMPRTSPTSWPAPCPHPVRAWSRQWFRPRCDHVGRGARRRARPDLGVDGRPPVPRLLAPLRADRRGLSPSTARSWPWCTPVTAPGPPPSRCCWPPSTTSLLGGLDHPLADVYAGRSSADPAPLFRSVCLDHRDEIARPPRRPAGSDQRLRAERGCSGPGLTWMAERVRASWPSSTWVPAPGSTSSPTGTGSTTATVGATGPTGLAGQGPMPGEGRPTADRPGAALLRARDRAWTAPRSTSPTLTTPGGSWPVCGRTPDGSSAPRPPSVWPRRRPRTCGRGMPWHDLPALLDELDERCDGRRDEQLVVLVPRAATHGRSTSMSWPKLHVGDPSHGCVADDVLDGGRGAAPLQPMTGRGDHTLGAVVLGRGGRPAGRAAAGRRPAARDVGRLEGRPRLSQSRPWAKGGDGRTGRGRRPLRPRLEAPLTRPAGVTFSPERR